MRKAQGVAVVIGVVRIVAVAKAIVPIAKKIRPVTRASLRARVTVASYEPIAVTSS